MSTSIETPRRLHALDDAQIDALAEVLIDCVEGGASVGFMQPMTRDRAAAFWRRVARSVEAGERLLLVAEDEQGLCGTVQLILDLPENQPHRADLAKMLVHRRARRRGVAASLLRAAEDAALGCGRTLLVLDAVTGGDAARLYERLGWVRVGDVPGYASDAARRALQHHVLLPRTRRVGRLSPAGKARPKIWGDARGRRVLSGEYRASIGTGGRPLAIRSSLVPREVAALFRVGTLTGLSDGALLERFRYGTAEEAEAAFAVLVDRHGAMVLAVCRRILGDRHDAEDAVQATFLVLSRRAGTIRRGESLSSWLHGTAARVAGRARRSAARRRARERRGVLAALAIRRDEPVAGSGPEAWPELYEELERLPDRFRLPVLLCHLEGLSHEQAAGRLGCPVRTIQSRLSRAREKLRAGLIRRGVAPGSAARCLVLGLRPDVHGIAAPVSAAWMHATAAAAARHGAVSHAVATLAEGVSRAMLIRRAMRGATAGLLVAAVAGGMGLGMRARSQPPGPTRPAAAAQHEPRYRADFHSGAAVEVIAVSTVPTGPKTWWKPDGTPLAEVPADPIAGHFGERDRPRARVILVRLPG